jgi:two-component system, OmpR family, phosphate regulon sensor histidine kinase PhoR
MPAFDVNTCPESLMALEAQNSPTFYSPWPDRLRHSAIILMVAAFALAVVVVLGELSPLRASAIFICIAAAALVPWRLHNVAASREDVRNVNPVETAAVSAVVAGMPDPAVLLDRAGRVLHLNAAAAQLAPALRKNELAQFALRSPEIITALREAISTTEPCRATYLDQVPVDRWMELIITPVPVPTLFGGTEKCMLMTFHDQTPLRRVEEMRADFVANASHELRTPLAALSGFIDTLQGPAREDAKARERFLGIMHTQATRMARLIDDLLSLSRVELSAHVRPDASVDIVPILRQVADGLEPLAREPRNSGSWCAISAPVSRRSTCRGSPSGSTGSMSATAAPRVEPGSVYPLLNISLPAIAAGF